MTNSLSISTTVLQTIVDIKLILISALIQVYIRLYKVHWHVWNTRTVFANNKLLSTHTQSHTLYPLLKTSAFPVSPIMQEQAALLPGSQAGEEGTAVWSHGAHPHPPPFLLHPPSLHSSHLSLSFSHSVSPSLSLTSSSWLSPLSLFTSHTGPHRFTLSTSCRRTHTHTDTNKHAMFSHLEAGCSPDRRIFSHVTDMVWRVKNTGSIFTGCIYLLVWK